MLVLLSFALVLAATVLLVIGLLIDDGLTLIYLSIACSAAAAVVLVVAVRRSKPAADVPLAPVAETPVTESRAGPATEEEARQEAIFPIADYDELTAGQILPLLPQLYPHEIGVVEAREQSTKARPEILDRLAELRADEPTAVPATAVPADSARDDEDEWFPIDDYESLTVAKIRPLLRELDREELIIVRDRELSLGQRRTVLADIDRRLASSAPAETAAPADEWATPAEDAADRSQ